MTWKVSDPMSERVKFIGLVESGQRTVAGLCREFGICRTTAYKYIQRFREDGLEGLKERSRAPHRSPRQTAPKVRQLLVDARKRHPTWGPRKLKAWLEEQDGSPALPYPSTIGDILKREGLVRARRRRAKPPAVLPTGLTTITRPNQEWDADFKGQFRLGNGTYCYPLTITDAYSRYLLEVRALEGTSGASSRPWFERVFREFGLPETLRTDNGAPFASSGLGRLSPLSIWWIKLGIRPIRGRPHHPEDNPRHERMHRTMKAETTRPPATKNPAQQLRFNGFQDEYNNERPHEALGQKPPARVYKPSPRRFPTKLPEIEYPSHWEVRTVGSGGWFAWHSQPVFISHALTGERIGLVEFDDGLWTVCFAGLELAILDEAKLRGLKIGKVYAMSPV